MKHAIAYTTGSGEVYGAKATINVWDPSIEEVNEFSLSQVWVLSGSFDGTDLNSIEAGWQVTHTHPYVSLCVYTYMHIYIHTLTTCTHMARAHARDPAINI